MIDQQTVDRIFDAADIVSVVSDYVSLKRRGANYWGTCPFHDEKTPSFSVSPAKNIYKCFGCGKGGNSANFIMGVENLSYYEALKFLAKKFHIEIKEKELSDEEKQQQNERESLLSLTDWVHKHFIANLHDTDEGRAVGMSYFAHRGFREDIIKKFQLGYAIDARDHYTNEALKAGYKLDFLEKTGLTIVKENGYKIDRFHGRVIFPIHSISGRVIAFGGRAIKKDELAKYQNSPESDIYHKSNVLYGLYFAKSAITKKKKCYIVEGYADVVSMVQAGVENIVAPCGTALTVQQIQILRRILPSADSERSEDKNVTLLYDGDAAGMHAALKNGKLLLEEGLNVKVVVLPEPEDPDSFAQNHESSEVIRYLEENEQDYISFKIRHYWKEAQSDPMKMSQLIEDVASTIEVIPDEVKRSIYAKMASNTLGVTEKVLYSRINAINRKKVEESQGPTLADEISQAQSVPPPEAVEPISSVSTLKDAMERDIVRCIVRYGNLPFGEDTDEEKATSVVEYITEDLQIVMEDLQMAEYPISNHIYRSMLEDYAGKFQETGISPENFFKRNVNPDYVRVAMELSVDTYPLSKMFDKDKASRVQGKPIVTDSVDAYMKEVLYAIYNLKSHCIQYEIEKRMKKIQTQTGEIGKLLEEIKDLKDCQKQFDKMLGERHILP